MVKERPDGVDVELFGVALPRIGFADARCPGEVDIGERRVSREAAQA